MGNDSMRKFCPKKIWSDGNLITNLPLILLCRNYAANFNCRKSNNTIVDIIKAWPEYAFRYSYQVILLLLPVVETVVKYIKPDISKKIYIMAFRKDPNNRSNKNSFQRLAHCSWAILAVCCIESCETRVLNWKFNWVDQLIRDQRWIEIREIRLPSLKNWLI